ncbi:uncharacterized protein LOC126353764 isoform X2 [Schistocerca gregaria]|uniref:uncharacterized protein LOC126353764 isoform X2 n=1 Tax=Schistocerca gregaria TaxID=7010 RepID=UPI00211DE085|nr:uncharacterized protein LOC126353764 isoform X2 [Schistocerca gregaria]
MPGMLFVVCVPTAEYELRLAAKAGPELRRLDGPTLRSRLPPPAPLGQLPMEQVLEDLLKKLGIEHVVWCKDKVGNYFEVFFPLGAGDPTENCLHCLTELGIGKKHNSIVSVVPSNVFYHGMNDGTADFNPDDTVGELIPKKNWNNFVQSVRSKLTVKQVVDGVRNGAELSFDYLLLVLTADIIAAVGLLENNSVNIVAAMLVSPLMGPVMAMTFGTIIADWKLFKIGLRSEAIGLLLSTLFGFIFGLLLGTTESPWGYGDWPTEEMKGRGNYRSLWVGVMWALPSGTGVALALLQGSAGPLIGVAISASLLPPAVNCGIMWALACTVVNDKNYTVLVLQGEDPSQPNFTSGYEPIYYPDSKAKELSVMGIISLCLTLINICCIFICAILVLKVKEVAAPYTSSPDLRRFWEHDIRMARDVNRGTVDGANTTNFRNTNKEFMDGLNKLPPENLGATLEAAVREAMDDPTFRKVKRLSYSRTAADQVTHSLGIGSTNKRRSHISGDPETPFSDPATLDQLIQTLVGQQKAAQGRTSRGHSMQQSVRRGSHSGHDLQSPPAQTQSPVMSVNLGLPTIMENSNARDSSKRHSKVMSIVQSIRDVPQRLTQPPPSEETTSLTDNIQLPEEDSMQDIPLRTKP